MDRWVAKLIALLLIFSLTLFTTLLPIQVHASVLRYGAKGRRVLSALMCFGGGVFLSVYMLHMTPDVKEIFTHAITEPYDINYPLAELTMICGFFLMVIIEYAVSYLSINKKKKVFNEIKVDAEELKKLDNDPENHLGKERSVELVEMNENHASNSQHLTTNNKHEEKDGHDPAEDTPHHHHEVVDLHSSRSILLLLALSLHHIFEGITIGLKHSVSAVWSLCIAIVCHEAIIGFSLGLQLVKSCRSRRRLVIYAVFCSIMVPVGVAIGMLMMETGADNSSNPALLVANGILQAISTGVFIYVTFFEILQDEMSHGEPDIAKLFSMLLGFAVMALLALIPEDTDIDEVLQRNCTCF